MVALPIFIIPYTFCYNPALLLEGGLVQITIAAVTAILGVFFINLCTVGYLRSRVNVFCRVLLLAGGILLLMPQYLPSLIGFVIGGVAFLMAWRKLDKAIAKQ